MTPPPEPSRAQRVRAKLLAGVGGLAAAGLSLGLAIWDKRQQPDVPTIELGQPVEAGRWTVRLIGARLSSETPDGRPVRGGGQALVVDMSLENRTAESSNLYSDVIRLNNAPAGLEPRPTFYLARDRETLRALQPRLVERVSAVWVWPAGATTPENLAVTLTGLTFKPRDNLYGAPIWSNAREVATATLPLGAGGRP
ncbi:hypothetical protein ACFOWB_12030 [Chenggangzhangella methanolivorans]|uniref:hypothetical protein n=1 Tax=Chenggangzhangella methanolivorans TaxID=1437009 RepID=UPI003608CEDD